MSEDDERKLGSPIDQQRWEVERGFREREVAAKERDLTLQEADMDLRRKAQASQWHNPLAMAIFAATITLVSNSVLTYLNGQQTLKLESNKAEFSRVADMLRTGGDPDKAAALLTFLVDVKLLRDPDVVAGLRNYVANRKPGSGVSLPSPAKKITLFPEPLPQDAATIYNAYMLVMNGIDNAQSRMLYIIHHPNTPNSLKLKLEHLVLVVSAEKALLSAELSAYSARASYISPFTESELQQIETLVSKLSVTEISTENFLSMFGELMHLSRTMRLTQRQIKAQE